jgi:hypothetical protein
MPEQSKIVINLPEGLIKGHLTADSQRLLNATPANLQSVTVNLLGSGEEREVSLREAKGIFFVKEFDGNVDHSDLRFHDGNAPAAFLWVRLTFLDGEVIEGMIQNAAAFIVSDGIWVTPTDPTGNNVLIYASKSHLQNFEVLGLRQKSHRRAI